jgi:ubiquinone/menaquinone biosynthesis C-methylase UbiE
MPKESYKIKLIKTFFKLKESTPNIEDVSSCAMSEFFNSNYFLNADDLQKKHLMLQSSNIKYNDEIDYPWDNYFSREIKSLLSGKTVLDLGCFSGGRSVAWKERYKISSIYGIDISDKFIESANQFAQFKKVDNYHYSVSKGEALEFNDNFFDAILSFDVFEHVQNLKTTLSECNRVLKEGGYLICVFPSFYHPIEHHLNNVTKVPFIHYFFSANNILIAYNSIIKSRGESAYWYRRSQSNLQDWEKGNTINGTTYSKFISFVKEGKWEIVNISFKPIGSIGRNISKYPAIKIFTIILYFFAKIPLLREFFLHRITFILQKSCEAPTHTC